VKLITEKFEDIDPSDERVSNIKLALITAQCSRSGVTNPVNFILSEGDGIVAALTATASTSSLLLTTFYHILTV